MAYILVFLFLCYFYDHLQKKRDRDNCSILILKGICPKCEGSGQIAIFQSQITQELVACGGYNCSGGTKIDDQMPCYTCGGSGKELREFTKQVQVGTKPCTTCHGDGKYVPGSITISAPGLLDRIFDFLWAVICLVVMIFGFGCVFGIIGAIWQTALGQGTSAKDSIGDRVGLFVVLSGFLVVIFFIERWVWRHFKRFIRDAFT